MKRSLLKIMVKCLNLKHMNNKENPNRILAPKKRDKGREKF